MTASLRQDVAKVPARLFAILAREAPIGVILRRGPSKWVELILWHTDTDNFDHGQWFKGTIYNRACDLSPDGSKFLYFGSKYHLQRWDATTNQHDRTIMYEWTAISTPPYYTALALWPYLGPDNAWGGHFMDNSTLYLRGTSNTPAQGALPNGWKVILGSENAEQFRRKRLLLGGWHVDQKRIWQYPPGRCAQPEVQRKDSGSRYSLLLETDLLNSYTYFLEDRTTKERLNFVSATWMDWDQQGRLVFTKEGRLYASPADNLEPKIIGDFNSDEITEIIAPDWAREW